jgi:hypothetical protein
MDTVIRTFAPDNQLSDGKTARRQDGKTARRQDGKTARRQGREYADS